MTTWKLFWVIMGAVTSVVVAVLLYFVPIPALQFTVTPFWTTIGICAIAAIIAVMVARWASELGPGIVAGVIVAILLRITIPFTVRITSSVGWIIPIAVITAISVAVLTARITRFVMLDTAVMKGVPADTVQEWSYGVGLAAALHIAWVTATRVVPDHPVILITALVALAVLEHWTAVLLEWLEAHRKPKPQDNMTPAERILAAVLIRTELTMLVVKGSYPIGINKDTGDSDGMRFTLSHLTGKPDVPANAEDRIARALQDILETELARDWVNLRKNQQAGGYTLNVTQRDTKADIIPYVDSVKSISIMEPQLVGYDYDTPYYLLLCQHGQDIGKTRSGKSSLINVKLARLTLCTDAIVWTCGAEKLYDLVGAWVEPYMDSGYELPFDWIANGQSDTLGMLIAAMVVARWRQRQPLETRVGWPHIVIVLDEASFALRNRSVIGTYQGQTVNASQMAAMISQGAGSANIWLLRATQRSTYDHSGDSGGDVSTNAGYSSAFMSKDWAEVGRLMNDFSLPMPSHPGEYWLDAGDGIPVLLKAPYIQEVDPSKPKLHSGVTVSDVARARQGLPRTKLDPGSAQAAGKAYAARYTRMDSEMRAYLTGEPTPTTGLMSIAQPLGSGAPMTPYQVGYNLVMGQLGGLSLTPPEPVSQMPENGVITMAARRTRPDRIAEILNASDEPMSYEDLVAELRKTEDPPIPDTGLRRYKTVVSNALGQMVAEGRVQRLERGVYSKAS